ncbi:YlcI/YnfO family protein [Xanthomonas nasturtii]|nr:YlcI/YnfO family protein [Xanthomonas nasturtii]WVL53898.1 YlcI/YnfO family protein [Xanthomonas nasturtii]
MRSDDPNLPHLLVIADALGELRDHVVFLGGAVVGLLVSDPLAESVRATYDVDAVVNLDWARFRGIEARVESQGFAREMQPNRHAQALCFRSTCHCIGVAATSSAQVCKENIEAPALACDNASQLQRTGLAMKSASLPSLRVDPALREAAEAVLQEGETLSSFVEHSVRAQVQQRQQQEAFIARGLASRDSAKASGRYIDTKDVMTGLQSQLDKTRNG